VDSPLRPEFLLFHEGPSRILISTADAARVREIAAAHGVEALEIGVTTPGRLTIDSNHRGLIDWSAEALGSLWENALARLLHP
jgi:phosphoribosylformylglycinamidine synthase